MSLPPGNVGFDKFQHVQSGFVQLDEDPIVDLSKSKQLKNFAHTRTYSIDTGQNSVNTIDCHGSSNKGVFTCSPLYPDNKAKPRLSRYKVATTFLS